MNPVDVLACGVGFVSGLIAAWLSTATSSRLGDRGFWLQLASVSRLLLSDEEGKSFLREYVRLWPLLAKFVLKKLVVTLTVILPIALALGALTLMPEHGPDAERWEIPFLVAASLSTLLGLAVLRRRRGRAEFASAPSPTRSENRAS